MLKLTLQTYLNRLVDLSSRNRSVYMPKLPASQMIDLKDLNFLNGKEDFDIIRNLISKKKDITLCPTLDQRDKQNNQQSLRLKKLANLSDTLASETGEKSLYIAWPFVEGKLTNGQLLRCPLILFPVSLSNDGKTWTLKRPAGEEPELNQTFLLALAHALSEAPVSFDEQNPLAEFGKDPTEFRNQLYEFLKINFPVNFSQELYEDKIIRFPDTGKALDEERLGLGQMQLRPYAVLGHFSQKTSFLIGDYEQLLERENHPDLEHLFESKFTLDEGSRTNREEQLYTVFPVDSSQEKVLKAVRSGHSCVVEGPPGTGKSQLISNLAVDYISRGKKVLIVSQKRAALDVVSARLSEKGFGDFIGLVHDFRADRKMLFQKIQQQIQQIDRYQELNRSIDAIQLEREFSQLSRTVDNLNEYFEDYRKALFNTEECGIPIKELYLSSSLEEESYDLTQHYRRLTFDQSDQFVRDMKEFALYYRQFQQPDSFWLHRVDFSSFGPSSQTRLKEVLEEIFNFKTELETIFNFHGDFEPSFLFHLLERKEKLEQLVKLLEDPEVFKIYQNLQKFDPEAFDLLWLQHKIDIVKKLLSQEGVEWSCPEKEIEDCLTLSIQYQESKRRWFGNFRWPWQKSRFEKIQELLIKNGLKDDDQGIQTLITKLENRLNLNHQLTLLSGKKWLSLPSQPFDFSDFNHFGRIHEEAVKSRLHIEDWNLAGQFINQLLLTQEKGKLSILLEKTSILESKLPAWYVYLSKIQVQHLFVQSLGKEIQRILDSLPKIFDQLVGFDQLRSRIGHSDRELMEKVLDHYPDRSIDEICNVFISGLKKAWIDHIEKKYPVLREICTPKSFNFQQEFMEAVEKKWQVSRHIVELRLRERTFKNLKFNRLGNLLTYRELSHQVSKKKRIWSVRKLIAEFESEIFELMPCWLASPETVSAIFPLEQHFDLVIFDESSQCYVERGLPAMLRGKQVVVAGDSQQLQPFDLYKVRLETEEEGVELETDSLLDLSSKYFQKHWLQGHYRSLQPELIHFSNREFYENKLEMLSSRKLVNQNSIPFSLHRADGIWDNQTNKEEAENVVSILKALQKEHPKDQIGIITFNFFQMEYIREQIEKDHRIHLQRVKVKNIENVQGDEFDQVIFSIGYAKNKKGKLIANFGMLSKKGGVNRLNVAITRARKKIHLVTSLSSRDFSPKQLKNEGIASLKNYIEFVESAVNDGQITYPEQISQGYEYSWFLKNKLEGQNGTYTISKYPASQWLDLVWKKGSEIEGAYLTDDQRLYNAVSAKEAFVYHPIQLKEKDWPYQFVFSRQYWLGQSL